MRLRVPALVAVMGLAAPPPAAADVYFTFGNTVRVEAPDPMDSPVNQPQAFSEGTTTEPLTLMVNESEARRIEVEPSLPRCDAMISGEDLASDFVFQNPDEASRSLDVLVFPGRVLGVSYDHNCLSMTGGFERPDVTYPGDGGLELGTLMEDGLEIVGSRRAVFHRLSASGPGDWDGYRVISEIPQVEADTSIACSATFEGVIVAEGDVHVVTMTLTNAGPEDAPDVQIVFRHHVTMTVTSIEGPFTCTEIPDLRTYVCTYDDETLSAMATTPELRVTLRFDRAPSLTSRVAAFGSGAAIDMDLARNDCFPLAMGPDPDGGSPDAGEDADVGSGAADTGSSPGPGTAFRGGGGCECRGASGALGTGAELSLFAMLILAWRRQARR